MPIPSVSAVLQAIPAVAHARAVTSIAKVRIETDPVSPEIPLKNGMRGNSPRSIQSGQERTNITSVARPKRDPAAGPRLCRRRSMARWSGSPKSSLNLEGDTQSS